MFLRTCRSFKSAKHNKDWVRKSQIRGRSANLTNYLSPQICLFAICGSYLTRTKNNRVGNSRTWKSHSLYILAPVRRVFSFWPNTVGLILISTKNLHLPFVQYVCTNVQMPV